MRNVMFGLCVLFVAAAVGCKKEAPAPAPVAAAPEHEKMAAPDVNKDEIQRVASNFVDDYGTVVGGLYKESALAYWKAANTGDKASFDEYAAKELEVRKYLSDTDRYAKLQQLRKHGNLLEPVTARALEVIELAYKENQLPADMLKKLVEKSSEIEMTFKTHRAEIDGKKYSNNELLDVLGAETDTAKRKQAWEALKQVGAVVGPMLLDLARTRNEAAKLLGYANYWEMRMRMQEHDPDMVVKLFEDLKAKTDKPFFDMKGELDRELAAKFGMKPEELMPWHYDNPFFQQAPPAPNLDLDIFYKHMAKEDIVTLAQKFYTDIGMPIDQIIANSDYYEREGKDQHAFCTDIDRMGDVRMLLNVKPTAEWMDTMLHEAGHAAYAKYNNPKLPWALRDAAHILTTEGIAMLFGALAKNPAWLKAYAKADPAMVDKVAPELAKQRKREQLIFARWAMVMFFFEKDLYTNPDNPELNKIWYDRVVELQGLVRPAERTAADWAAKPHFTIAPVYYHNYLLGELFATMLRAKLSEIAGHTGPASELDFVGKADFGRFIIAQIFEPGMVQPWPEFVKTAFGKPFTPDAFVAEVQ